MLSTLGENIELVERIGDDGSVKVYRAVDVRLRRMVAVKILEQIRDGDDSLVRLRREADFLAQLNHPHIAKLYSFAEQQGEAYMVTEYADGGTVESRLRQSVPLRLAETLTLFDQALQAVAYAHARGVVLRNISASSLLLRADGTVMLCDLREASAADTSESADFRSDISALGVVLHELAAGAHRTARLPALTRILETAQHNDPDARFQTVDDFRQALAPVLTKLLEVKAPRSKAPARRAYFRAVFLTALGLLTVFVLVTQRGTAITARLSEPLPVLFPLPEFQTRTTATLAYDAIPFRRTVERTLLLPRGERRIKQEGKPGRRERTVRVESRWGHEWSRETVASRTVERAIPEVVLLGVRPPPEVALERPGGKSPLFHRSPAAPPAQARAERAGVQETRAATESIYCPNCGKPNPRGAKFCGFCGKPL